MADEFIHCPRCGSTEISETDYEIEEGVIDPDGRRCDKCCWEGDSAELVSD